MTRPWQQNPALATSANPCEPFTIRIKPILDSRDSDFWYAGRVGEAFVVTGEVPGVPGHWIVDTAGIADEIPGGEDYAFVLKPYAERIEPEGG